MKMKKEEANVWGIWDTLCFLSGVMTYIEEKTTARLLRRTRNSPPFGDVGSGRTTLYILGTTDRMSHLVRKGYRRLQQPGLWSW
jgi:hypothetical protein